MSTETLIPQALALVTDMGSAGVHRAGREAELRSLLSQIRAAGLTVPDALSDAEARIAPSESDDDDLWDNMPV